MKQLEEAKQLADLKGGENNLSQHQCAGETKALIASFSLFVAAAILLQTTIKAEKCDSKLSTGLIMKYVGGAAMQVIGIISWWYAGNWYNRNQGILDKFIGDNERLDQINKRLAALNSQIDVYLGETPQVMVDVEQLNDSIGEWAKDVFMMRIEALSELDAQINEIMTSIQSLTDQDKERIRLQTLIEEQKQINEKIRRLESEASTLPGQPDDTSDDEHLERLRTRARRYAVDISKAQYDLGNAVMFDQGESTESLYARLEKLQEKRNAIGNIGEVLNAFVNVYYQPPSGSGSSHLKTSTSTTSYGGLGAGWNNSNPVLTDQEIDTHWYTNDELNKLLEHYTKNYSDVHLFPPIPIISENKDILVDNLVEFQRERLGYISNSSQKDLVKNRVIIPLQIDHGHWVFLFIKYGQDTTKLPHISYVDPKGHRISPSVISVLQNERLYPDLAPSDVVVSYERLQPIGDRDNCGPWVVECVRRLLAQEPLPDGRFNIQHKRNEQQIILKRTGAVGSGGNVVHERTSAATTTTVTATTTTAVAEHTSAATLSTTTGKLEEEGEYVETSSPDKTAAEDYSDWFDGSDYEIDSEASNDNYVGPSSSA